MKKSAGISMGLLAVTLVAASCTTLNQNVRPNYKIIDHKGVLAGARVPGIIKDAMTQPAEDLSRKYFRDSYVFVANQKGRELDGLVMWSKNFEVQAEVAKRIQSSIDFSAKNSVSGNKDLVESTMEVVTEIVAQQQVSGLQMQQDWWIKLQYEDDQEEYQYVAVYAIKKTLLDNFMNEAIERASAQRDLDDESAATIAKLKEELSASGYGMEESEGELSKFAFGPDIADAE